MGKRKAKKKSNSVNKTNSYLSRYQVKFARRRAGTFFDFIGTHAGGEGRRACDVCEKRMIRRDATSASSNGYFSRDASGRARDASSRPRERAHFSSAHFSSRFSFRSLVLTIRLFLSVVTKQQVKPITKLAVHSSLKTRTSTIPRSTDLSSDSRTNASFARLSTPPSRAM